MSLIISDTITLLLVMDPFGNIPTFLSVLSGVNEKHHRRIIIREMLIALFILGVFLFGGRFILEAMHISEPALPISGGVILFMIALRMIFPTKNGHKKDEPVEEPLIVPLAMPLVAGPSTMVMLILMSSRVDADLGEIFLSLALAWGISAVILSFSDLLRKLLGTKILKAIERFMGMILTAMAVQMLLNGIEKFVTIIM